MWKENFCILRQRIIVGRLLLIRTREELKKLPAPSRRVLFGPVVLESVSERVIVSISFYLSLVLAIGRSYTMCTFSILGLQAPDVHFLPSPMPFLLSSRPTQKIAAT